MKKHLLIIFALFIATWASAQPIFTQDFSSGTFPPSGWMIFGNPANWSASPTNHAGGTAPEMHITGAPLFTGYQRIISPKINTSGSDQLIFRMKHKFDHASGNTAIKIGVETRSANGGWNSVWMENATASIPAQTLTIIIDNANVGASDFQFCIYVNGVGTHLKDWYIDDIEISNPYETDAAMASVDLPPLFVGSKIVKGTFINVGQTLVTAADVNWQVADGEIHTDSFTDLGLSLGESYLFECTDSLILPPANYTVKVWISAINGLEEDDNPANDTLWQNISIPTQLINYRPFFEEFTSSTCGPCAGFNNSFFNNFVASHEDEITLIKYQMNWPGSGDPYYTAEGGVRRNYYGVSGVPDLYVDGKKTGTNSGAVNSALGATLGTLAYVDIVSTHEIMGNNVILNASIVPYADYPGVKVHMAIIEKVTTQNVGSNGETEFHHVMMKMLPNANGTSANLVSEVPLNLQFTQDMSGTNVEEMDDLMVAIFIQDSDKTIKQSGYSLEIGASTTVNLANGAVNVPVDQSIIVDFSQPVRMRGGTPITEANIAEIIHFKEDNAMGSDVPFTATINSAKTQIVVTPSPNLAYLQDYYFRVDALENYAMVATLPVVREFITVLNVDVPAQSIVDYKVYPNPANSMIYINNVKNLDKVELISVVGNVVRSVSDFGTSVGETGISVSNLPGGMYFIRLTSGNQVKTQRVIVTK